MKKRGMSVMLALALIVSVLLTAMPVSGAAADGSTVTLGAGALTVGSRVWFGDQILWRVLKSGDSKALLISNSILASIRLSSIRPIQVAIPILL